MSNDDQPDIRALRQAAEQGKAAQARADKLERDLMFARAGIDTETSKVGKMLYQTWDGDDVAALKAEATELGLIGQPAKAEDPPAPATAPPSEGERQMQDLRGQLQSGTAGQPPKEADTPSPWEKGYEKFHNDLRAGSPRERAAVDLMQQIVQAGAAGDKRVLFDQEAHNRRAAEIDAMSGIR